MSTHRDRHRHNLFNTKPELVEKINMEETGFTSRTAMLLQKSRPFKERLAYNSLTKDVLIIFTATESTKVDTLPFTAQPWAGMFATTKQRTILPHDSLFLGERKPCSPNPKKAA